MIAPAWTPVFVDRIKVELADDPRPSIATIVAAAGKSPADVWVLRGSSPEDRDGHAITMGDTIERTPAGPPIYLVCIAKSPATGQSTGAIASAEAGALAPRTGYVDFHPKPPVGPARPSNPPLRLPDDAAKP